MIEEANELLDQLRAMPSQGARIMYLIDQASRAKRLAEVNDYAGYNLRGSSVEFIEDGPEREFSLETVAEIVHHRLLETHAIGRGLAQGESPLSPTDWSQVEGPAQHLIPTSNTVPNRSLVWVRRLVGILGNSISCFPSIRFFMKADKDMPTHVSYEVDFILRFGKTYVERATVDTDGGEYQEMDIVVRWGPEPHRTRLTDPQQRRVSRNGSIYKRLYFPAEALEEWVARYASPHLPVPHTGKVC